MNENNLESLLAIQSGLCVAIGVSINVLNKKTMTIEKVKAELKEVLEKSICDIEELE